MRRRTPGTRLWVSRCWAVTAQCPCKMRPSLPARWSSSPTPTHPLCLEPATILRFACITNKPGTPLGCGLSSFLWRETWHARGSHRCCMVHHFAGSSFCGIPGKPPGQASVSQMGKPRPRGGRASQIMTTGQWCLAADRNPPGGACFIMGKLVPRKAAARTPHTNQSVAKVRFDNPPKPIQAPAPCTCVQMGPKSSGKQPYHRRGDTERGRL